MRNYLKIVFTAGIMMLVCLEARYAPTAEGPAELAPMVVTATMAEKTLDVAPGAVQVVTQKEIEELGAETVGDVLLYATGVMLTGGEGRNLGTSIRGLGYNHTLVLIDGRRLAASFKSQMDVAQLPAVMIERIEIVRGPVSALYGSDAIGGVVNIITRRPTAKTNAAVDLRAGVGPSAEQSTQAQIGGGYGPLRANLGLGRSIKDDWDGDGELPDDIDQMALNSAVGRLALDLSQSQTLSAGGEYGHLSRDGGRFYQSLDRRFEADDRRWNGFATYELHPDGPFSGLLRAYLSEYKRTSSFDPWVAVDNEERKLAQAETRGDYVVNDRLLLTAGGEYRQESLTGGGLDDDKSVDNGGLFLQADWQLLDRLNLVAGARYDHYENFGSQVTPRTTLSWFFPGGRVWVGYGQGFRAPNLNELYVTSLLRQGMDTYRGNPGLDAETSESYETGIYYHQGRLWGQLTLFHNKLKDLITTQLVSQVTSGKKTYRTYEYANLDEVVTEGSELEAGINLPANLSLSGDWTWLDTENRSTDTELTNEPGGKGGLTLGWRYPAWQLSTQMRWLYLGESKDSSGDTQAAYDLVHLYVSKGFTPQFSMYLGIDNLFDEECDDFTLSPRQLYAGLNWRF